MSKLFKFLSLLSLIFFYAFLASGLFVISSEAIATAKPESAFAKSWGFDPVYTDFNIYFHHFPDLYNDPTFRLLDLVTEGTTFLLIVLVLWYLHKLFKNIYKDNLFVYKNVSVIFRLGFAILVFGTVSSFTNGLLESRVISELQIKNAEVVLSNLSYLDYLLTGFVLMIVSIALKKAVQAVEENKDTI